MSGPGEVIFDKHTEELEPGDFLNSGPSRPEVHDHLLSLADVEREIFGGLIIVGDEIQDGCVVRKLKHGVGPVCGYAVVHVQGVQEWTKYARLRGSGAQGQCRGSETAHTHYLKSRIQLKREEF